MIKNRTAHIWYWITITVVFAAVFWIALLGDIPQGISGQPRSGALAVDWHPTYRLLFIYLISYLGLLFVPFFPLIGVGSYLFLSYIFPVHTPEWLFTQWLKIRLLVAVFTVVGCLIRHYPVKRWMLNLRDPVTILFSSFFGWYMICAMVAFVRDGQYIPPLQFSPVYLFEAWLLFFVIVMDEKRINSLFLIAGSMALILLVRIIFIQTSLHKDADIAGYMVISLPLFFFSIMHVSKWWIRWVWIFLTGAGVYVIYVVQNRGAVVGFLLAVLAYLFTMKKGLFQILFSVSVVAVGLFCFIKTPLGEQFVSIVNDFDKVWSNNLRIITWRGGLQMALDHFIFGVGPGNFLLNIGEYVPRVRWHSAHNIFVDVFAEGGIIGLVLYLSLLGKVLSRCYRSELQADRFVLIALFTYVGFGMFLSQTMMVLPYLLFAVPLKSMGQDVK